MNTYLRSLAYKAGSTVRLDETKDVDIVQHVDELIAEGITSFALSDVPAVDLAFLSAEESLAGAGKEIGMAILISESAGEGALWKLLERLGLDYAVPVQISGQGCANLGVAIEYARQSAFQNSWDVLVIAADDVGESRFQPLGMTVFSDMAASFIVSPLRPACGYRILASSNLADANVARADAETAMRLSAERLHETLVGLGTSWEFDHVILPKFGASTRTFLSLALGIDQSTVRIPSTSGHAFASDGIIALAELLASDDFKDGQEVLQIGTSTRSWALTVLEVVRE